MILDCEPDTQIGSLPEIAQTLGVGIVTVQQAARILEHEGLLAVRRGPGGGYYGKRPDAGALQRALAAYMRVHRSEEHTSEIQSLMRISYAVFCLNKKKHKTTTTHRVQRLKP